MRVVGVEDFRAAMDQPELRGIAEIRARDGGRRVSEGIRTVPHGFVLESEVLMLDMHVVDAERLTAVVQRAAAGTIRVRERVTLGEEVPLLVHRTEGFITDFMINQHEFTEIRPHRGINDRLPAASHLGRLTLAERIEIPRPLRFHHKGPEHAHHGQLTVIAVGMELAPAFLRVGMDVPFHLHALALRGDGIPVRRRGGFSGRADQHAGAVDMQAHRLAPLQRVSQRDPHAIPLIAPDHQRLDVITLNTIGDGAGIVLVLLVFASRLVLGLFGTDLFKVLREGVHVAGVEVEPLVQRDLDVDGGDIVFLDRRGGGASAARDSHRLRIRLRGQKKTLPIVLMHRGHAVEHAGIARLPDLHLACHLFHEPVMLHLNQRGPGGAARHGVLHDGLAFELLRPRLIRVIHHAHRGMVAFLSFMGICVGSTDTDGKDKSGGEKEHSGE